MTNPFDGAELIDVYTRAQAIEDGFLVEVGDDIAQEAGFTIPIALTRAVFVECVEWDPEHRGTQSEEGRLWDVLWMARCFAQVNKNVDRYTFQVLRVPNTPKARIARSTSLVCHCGPGDNGEPVITIMLPGES